MPLDKIITNLFSKLADRRIGRMSHRLKYAQNALLWPLNHDVLVNNLDHLSP